MTLYLIDKPYGANGLKLAARNPEAHVVLVRDGVYLDVEGMPSSVKIYALADDVLRRGLGHRLENRIELIDYGGLVDLIVEHKVVNFA